MLLLTSSSESGGRKVHWNYPSSSVYSVESKSADASEDKTDTVLCVRSEEAAVTVHSQTEAKGEFLYPVLSYSSAESVCRSDADFRTVIVCIGSEPYGYKIGVLDFKSLLTIAISILVDNKGFDKNKLYELEGLANANL